jgi:hypothetical protein
VLGFYRVLALVCTTYVMTACTSLYHVHDPQTGVISAGELPRFLKSVRCEMITFYQISRERQKAYVNLYKTNPEGAFNSFAFFEIDPFLFGTFFLELKVVDSAGIGSGTVLDYKRILGPTSSDVTHVGPTASAQGTYDLIWSFLLKQNAQLASDTRDYRLPSDKQPMFYVPHTSRRIT